MAHVAADSIRKFDEWKLHGKSQYLIWQLAGSEISIVKEAESSVDWESFAKQLLQREAPCWVTYKFQYKTKEGGQRSKLTYITWIPKTTSLKDKMQYAMWSGVLKTAVTGIHCNLQAFGPDDLVYSEVLERVSKFERDEM